MIYGSPPGGWAHGCRDDMVPGASGRGGEQGVREGGSVKWLRQGEELTPLPRWLLGLKLELCSVHRG